MAPRVCLASDSSHLIRSVGSCTCLQCGAGTACCAKLAAAKFSSNLPVLIVDTGGKQFDRSISKDKLPVKVCSCGAPPPGQDYAYNVEMSYRGGVNSSAHSALRAFHRSWLCILEPNATLTRMTCVSNELPGCICIFVLRECPAAEYPTLSLSSVWKGIQHINIHCTD